MAALTLGGLPHPAIVMRQTFLSSAYYEELAQYQHHRPKHDFEGIRSRKASTNTSTGASPETGVLLKLSS